MFLHTLFNRFFKNGDHTLDPSLEKRIREDVTPILRKGREQWDLPHTLASVHYIKEIISGEGGNAKILVTAMYLHDVGYSLVYNLKDAPIYCTKKRHMETGKDFAGRYLTNLPYTWWEISEVQFLVGNHDNYSIRRSKNLQTVFEADTLGQMDRDMAGGTKDETEKNLFLLSLHENRFPNFKTKTGISLYKNLAERYNIINNLV